MAYFVTYKLASDKGRRTTEKNIILKRTHPVSWASNASSTGERNGKKTILLFWMPFENYRINENVKKAYTIED